MRAIGGVPTPFAVPPRGVYADYRWANNAVPQILAWTNTTAPSVLEMFQLNEFCFSFSRQRSATSTGYVQEQGNNDYRVDSSIGGGSPTYDYSSSGYNSRLQQPAAQRRVNSEGELLSSYHRGDDGVMNYSMPMTGSLHTGY